MAKVFISYSHKDEEWKDRVVTQLGVLARDAKLQVWDDRRIAAGDDWLPEIKTAIQSCDIALLLISADFLTSNFILGQEVPQLLQRRVSDGIRVIPVILRPCAWTQVSWLKGIQARPKDGKPLSSFSINDAEAALASLVEEVLRRTGSQTGDDSNAGTPETEFAGVVEKRRRIDAVVPSTAERSAGVDLFIQVRFATSPPLGIEDWPLEKIPSSLRPASETVNLWFPKNSRTGKLTSARLRIVVVTSDFDVQNGPERLLEVPPNQFSKLVSFLLKPKRTGECRINVEVYDLGKVLLGTVLLETTVGITAKQRMYRVAQLNLAVDVKSVEGADSPEGGDPFATTITSREQPDARASVALSPTAASPAASAHDTQSSGPPKASKRRRLAMVTGTGILLISGLFVLQFQLRNAGQNHSAYDPIHLYATSGDVPDLAAALARNPKALNLPDDAGLTPLHLAALNNRTNVVVLLLDKGADVNRPDKSGSTPLHLAAREGSADVVTRLLIKGAKINARDKSGRTPLAYAEQWHQEALVHLFRERGAIE